jgi:hypothetical protein
MIKKLILSIFTSFFLATLAAYLLLISHDPRPLLGDAFLFTGVIFSCLGAFGSFSFFVVLLIERFEDR